MQKNKIKNYKLQSMETLEVKQLNGIKIILIKVFFKVSGTIER